MARVSAIVTFDRVAVSQSRRLRYVDLVPETDIVVDAPVRIGSIENAEEFEGVQLPLYGSPFDRRGSRMDDGALAAASQSYRDNSGGCDQGIGFELKDGFTERISRGRW